MLGELSSAIRSRTSTNPRTVLAFLGTVLVAVSFAGVAAVGLLAGEPSTRWLVAWVLGALFLLVVAVLGIVLGIAWRDPSRLMLGQVTGTEYAEIRRVQLGDTVTGFHAPAVDAGGHRRSPALAIAESVEAEEDAPTQEDEA